MLTFDYENPPSRLQMLMDVRVYAAAAWRIAIVAIGCYFTVHLIKLPMGFDPLTLQAFVNMAVTAIVGIATLGFFVLFIPSQAIRAWDLFWYFAHDAGEAQTRREAREMAKKKQT